MMVMGSEDIMARTCFYMLLLTIGPWWW